MFNVKSLSKKDQQLVETLISEIESAAVDLEVSPRDVSYNAFVKWSMGKSVIKTKQNAIKRLGGFSTIRDAAFVENDIEEKVDSAKIKAEAKKNRLVTEGEVKTKLFLDSFQEVAEKIFKNKITPSGYARKIYGGPDEEDPRELNLIISDTHFQSCTRGPPIGLYYPGNSRIQATIP
jgi:hypothetical protein